MRSAVMDCAATLWPITAAAAQVADRVSAKSALDSIMRMRLGSLPRRWKRGRRRGLTVDGIDLHHLHARPVGVEQTHLPLVVHAHVDLQLARVAFSRRPRFEIGRASRTERV